MFTIIKRSGWLVGGLIFFMPILFIFFLASQMAYGQVQRSFAVYANIPEVTSLAALMKIPPEQVVMLRGRISERSVRPVDNRATDLLIYQERPAEGREVRYQEEFPLVFPEFIMDLPDGQAVIFPSLDRERVIQNELHSTSAGDREYTGFRPGDTVTVQGQRPAVSFAGPSLAEVTGITSVDKATFLLDWQTRFQYVRWARNGFGLLTLLGLILLIIELRRIKRQGREEELWKTPGTTTAPTI